MKFILFFFLVSVVSICSFVLAEDKITSSDFYQNYLNASQTVQESDDLKPIKATELPSIVLESFASSPFGEHTISQAYLIPAKEASNWIAHIMKYAPQNTPEIEESYLLSLHHKKNQTQVRFSKNGKLIKIIPA